jgi:magnesium-transporting ATPase (P-type)
MGVTVRMITGDNIMTARMKAVEANIIRQADINDPECC